MNTTSTLKNRLQELYEAMLALAPDKDWRWILRVVTKGRSHHASRKKRAEIPEAVELLELGLALMASADLETTPRKAAMRYRDGLIIAFLTLFPLRRADLAALQLGQNVSQETGKWRVRGTHSKTDQLFDLLWPEILVPMLETYLSVHRPVLKQQRKRWAQPIGNALWVSSDGSSLGPERLYVCVANYTAAVFGDRIGPHRFRHSAATSVAVNAPEHVAIIRVILGHAGHAIGGRYYNLAKTSQAARRFQQIMARLRDGTLAFPDDSNKGLSGSSTASISQRHHGDTRAEGISCHCKITSDG
ncbi:site-specific integrase [Siccirubricoccus sp. G192]|uniref:site-specific integrase n=1 Tax=Siccirubricoccus sp. G192 TaxID=2849651 RepID=UPI001C2C3FF0|nr:site-specific integrase [Siccirubricoccus sp. G192]MBV1800704.1 site-specific integrase [Siccirubricoccus sp. G192]